MSKTERISDETRVLEGQLVRNAIKSKKAYDNRYTQAYVASLIDREQTIFPQWLAGKTPIPDLTFIALAAILDFDPFTTRPHLRRLSEEIDKVKNKSNNKDSVNSESSSASIPQVPILTNSQALEFLRSKTYPEDCKKMPELQENTAHVAFGLVEESQQFEPAIMEGAIYYVLPMKLLNLKALTNRLVAVIIGNHVVVGRVKQITMGNISLVMPDKAEILLEKGLEQVIGLVTSIYNP